MKNLNKNNDESSASKIFQNIGQALVDGFEIGLKSPSMIRCYYSKKKGKRYVKYPKNWYRKIQKVYRTKNND